MFGVQSQEWSEEVVAIVASTEPFEEATLVVALHEERGRYKAPKRIRCAQTPLPHTATGKIDRLELSAIFEQLT